MNSYLYLILIYALPVLVVMATLIKRYRRGDRVGVRLLFTAIVLALADTVLCALIFDPAYMQSKYLRLAQGLCAGYLVATLFLLVTQHSTKSLLNKASIMLFLLPLMMFLPDTSVDVGQAAATAQMVRFDEPTPLGITIFHEGHVFYHLNWMTLILTLQFVVFIGELHTIRKKAYQYGSYYKGSAKMVVAWCALCIAFQLIAFAMPLHVWSEYEAAKMIFFLSSSFLVLYGGTLLLVGFDLNPVSDQNDRDGSVNEFIFECGDLIERLRRVVEHDCIYLEPGVQLEDLVDRLDANSSLVARAVRTQYGKSFPELVNTLRIEHSKKLLLASEDNNMQTIATACGYTTAKVYKSMFVRIEGMGPLEWKVQRQASHLMPYNAVVKIDQEPDESYGNDDASAHGAVAAAYIG